MNFIGHQFVNPWPADPWITVGNCLPDMFKFGGTRVTNSHNSQVLSQYRSDDPAINSVVRGMRLHIRCDRIFHDSEYFQDRLTAVASATAKYLADIPRRDVFVHLLVEILIDSFLNRQEPHLVEQIYGAFAQVDLDRILDSLKNIYPIRPDALKERIENFIARDYLRSYRDPESIFLVMKRLYQRLFSQNLEIVKKDAVRAVSLAMPCLEDYRKFLDSLKARIGVKVLPISGYEPNRAEDIHRRQQL